MDVTDKDDFAVSEFWKFKFMKFVLKGANLTINQFK